MKNYFITEPIKDLERFIVVMMTAPTVYVRSWHKVHPTAHFNKSRSFPVPKLQKMIAAGEFWECIKKTDVQSVRIRETLELLETTKMAQINAPTVDEAAEALAKIGSVGTTIGDVQTEVWRNRKESIK